MTQSRKFAVCLHVYYEDMWDHMSRYLAHMTPQTDIFVTCPPAIAATLAPRVRAGFGKAELIVRPNVGADILPFLHVCRTRRLFTYDAVLKLHTKNRRAPTNARHADHILDGLCGTRALVDDILQVFRDDPDAGLVGTAFQLRSANALMYGNREPARRILDHLGEGPQDWPFFAGTMFWSAGHLLRDLALMSDALLRMARADPPMASNTDGTVAHALERLLGAPCQTAGRRIYVTERQSAEGDAHLLMPLHRHGPCNNRRLLEASIREIRHRFVSAPAWCREIAASGLFDAAHYQAGAARHPVPGMQPDYHFALYGDLLGLDPDAAFDGTYYQIRHASVLHSQSCSVVHCHKTGTPPPQPDDRDWLDLAQATGLFDPQWYARSHPDAARRGIGAAEHYLSIGRHAGHATHPEFDPVAVPCLAGLAPQGGPGSVIDFLKRDYLDEYRCYETLQRAGTFGDTDLVRQYADRITGRFGPTRALRKTLATASTLGRHWQAAARQWADVLAARADEEGAANGPSRHLLSAEALHGATKPVPHPTRADPAARCATGPAAVCVYTTCFGDAPEPPPRPTPVAEADFICVTDRARHIPGWDMRVVAPLGPGAARDVLSLPHEYLQDYSHSLYVSAASAARGDLGALIDACLAGSPIILWPDPGGDDVIRRQCVGIDRGDIAPATAIGQLQGYCGTGLPNGCPVWDTTCLWRHHRAPEVIGLMKVWQAECAAFPGGEAIALAWIAWRHPEIVSAMPLALIAADRSG